MLVIVSISVSLSLVKGCCEMVYPQGVPAAAC
jgi:hypothetical protein